MGNEGLEVRFLSQGNKVIDEYKTEYCCSGVECGCYGLPVNPVFCDDCEKLILGKPNRKDDDK
ncbi:hypothetical protein [Niallia taxi]|uniref:hypothetical protein n=1 Tax=Niallia taxi TaxID=2499688 RepID=UPI0015F5D012|nr:hypothetical protein [Niallia taxi]